MKTRTFKWTLIIIIFAALANLPGLKTILTVFLDDGHYRYSNSSGTFTFVDIKSRVYHLNPTIPKQMMMRDPERTDTTVYRLFSKNPFAFWRWGDYFTDKRYSLPFMSWKKIKKRRGYELTSVTTFQQF